MNHTVYWTSEKLHRRLSLIEPLVYRTRRPLSPFRYQVLSSPSDLPPVGVEVDDSAWPTIAPHDYWATPDTNFVLRTVFEIPAEFSEGEPVALFLPLGEAGDFSHPETLVFIDGEPLAASDRNHQEVRLPARYCTGQRHVLALHGWSGSIHGRGPETRLQMRPCAVVRIDQAARNFVALTRVALGIADQLDANDPVKSALLNALDAAFKILDTREPFGEAFYDSIPAAYAKLNVGISAAGAPLDVSISAAGHAHIDVAWLWTLAQTRRKTGRTFHTVAHLMNQFPGYHFTQSQPQLYDYIRQDYPALFETIKQRVAEGRWEPIGGMWIEADCNLSGPESLARQFLLGRSFFRDHFGPDAESPVLWLPDVFGYTWSLPQLIKLAGLDYFYTIKLGWSQYNHMPYDSFWWQGIDGTRVLTHFSPNGNYNAEATPREIFETWRKFQQKAESNKLLLSFGFGDGGGGPTREMLENIHEMQNFPATPHTEYDTAGSFFARLEAEDGERLPLWDGELYLEYHRGTYTTQSRNKRANRKSEFLLHDAEFLASLASIAAPGYEYPAEALRGAWETVCLNQFHDIIPGSSIHDVYVDSQAQYAGIAQTGADVRDAALEALAAQTGGDVLLANPTAFERNDLAWWPGTLPARHRLETADGTPLPTQSAEGGTWIAPAALPPFSVTPLVIAPGEPPAAPGDLVAAPDCLENAYVRVELNPEGDITRIVDKVAGRDVLPQGALANQFQAFEDRPLNWDAWDIDIFYEDKQWTADPATSVEVVAGPLRATLKITRRILHSEYTQWISLDHNSPQIRVETDIDWRERHMLLKVAFPVEILAPQATYEIQWGNVQRPTHRNTSWDWARFESAAQKWSDLSEGDYGVSLLNDCKYGYDIHANVMRLSLLRSPTMPDPEADQGRHRFAYALLPHAGSWQGQTPRAAYALNDPLIAATGRGGAPTPLTPLLAVDAPNVVIETVKRAEDGNGLIVRLYESQRQRGTITLTAGFDLRSAAITNLIEDDQAALPCDGRQVTLPVKPYQIVTLRLVAAQ
ncbi:MAG TPA: alpha-mannosidase [Aggregatilinea sp.]|uniref:alpha-mannosidase n=1 Tax=Aggregatilinea sp. TaxID=2806333 RepID=UPI002CB15B3B|nr:alpha-mannosidase [Aggregatilinea sp.]HML21354.1 alpha-mannosidase [Aggregatilinea sp.]